jgi:hypothetical protein
MAIEEKQMYKSLIRRLRASCANAAPYHGPNNSSAKARSSQNAMRHGLLARRAVMAGESGQGFDAVLRQHLARVSTANGVDQGRIAAVLGRLAPPPGMHAIT